MITLTREEAQQVEQYIKPFAIVPVDMQTTQLLVNALRARLSAPEPEYRDVVIKGDLWRIEFLPDHAASVVLVRANYEAQPKPEPVTDRYLMEVECTKCGAKQDGVLTVTVPPQPEPEPVKLRRGDILRCIETNELCTVWATSTTGKTLVKWKANDFGSYTAEQIGDLFWVEPKPEPEPVAWNIKHNRPPLSSDNPHEVVAVIKREWQWLTDEEAAELCHAPIAAIEAKLREKNHD